MPKLLIVLASIFSSGVLYAASFEDIVDILIDELVNPLIYVLFAIAAVYFLWGVVEFIAKADSEEGRTQGKDRIIWGLVGLVIMVSVFGIINIIQEFFGFD